MIRLSATNYMVTAFAVLALTACGSPELETPESGPTATESGAVETSSDVPAASAIQVNHDNPALWIFSCDAGQHLVRSVRSSPTAPSLQSAALDSNCASVPVVEPNLMAFTATVWVRRTDNHLWKFVFAADGSEPVPPEDVSVASGIGVISGTPVPMGNIPCGSGTDYCETVAVRDGSNHLFTLVNFQAGGTGESWSSHHVLRMTGSNLVTQNTVNTTSFTLDNQMLAGRGSYSGDDASGGWAAPITNFRDPESTYQIALSIPGMTGTPTFGGSASDDQSSTIIVAPFGNTIMTAPWSNPVFTAIPGCATAGSPNGSRNIGYVRGKYADLVQYKLNTNSCQIMNGTGAVKLASAPSIVGDYLGHNFGYENDAFYKGVDSQLHYFDSSTQSHYIVGVILP
jgi:hypothetical protein